MDSIPHTVEYTIILPESLFDKIRDFQKYLSNACHLEWKLGETMILVLRYAIKDFDKISYYHLEVVKSYFAQKPDLLDEIYLNTIRSSHTGRNLCTVWNGLIFNSIYDHLLPYTGNLLRNDFCVWYWFISMNKWQYLWLGIMFAMSVGLRLWVLNF